MRLMSKFCTRDRVPLRRCTDRRSRDKPKTIAERLGYSADSKLLILHADDLAMAHSVDRATFGALDQGCGGLCRVSWCRVPRSPRLPSTQRPIRKRTSACTSHLRVNGKPTVGDRPHLATKCQACSSADGLT